MAGFLHNIVRLAQSKNTRVEDDKTFFEDVQQKAERYLQDRLLLIKLQATEKIAAYSPRLILALALTFVGFFILMIASFLLGYLFTVLTGSVFAGFGILLGLYVLLFFLMIAGYKRYFKKYFADMIVKMIFSNSNSEVDNGR